MIDLLDIMKDYEAGYLDTGETLELFAELIRTGRALVLGEGREGSPCEVNPEIVVGAFDDPIPGPIAVPNV